jgi:hypothetical protein
MTQPRGEEEADLARVDRRADLLPEEESVGSDEPEAQAAAILAESDERTEDPEGTRREYTQTMDREEGMTQGEGNP